MMSYSLVYSVCNALQAWFFMFYFFLMRDEQIYYLSFLWYHWNDPNGEMIDYRMSVHVFGNSPSPDVAWYGLNKIISQWTDLWRGLSKFLSTRWLCRWWLNFSRAQPIDLLTRTRSVLHKEGRLQLHKISYNSRAVMKAFTTEDLVNELKELVSLRASYQFKEV